MNDLPQASTSTDYHTYENLTVINEDVLSVNEETIPTNETIMPTFRTSSTTSTAADRASRNDIYNVDVLHKVVGRPPSDSARSIVRQSVNLMAFDENGTVPEHIWKDDSPVEEVILEEEDDYSFNDLTVDEEHIKLELTADQSASSTTLDDAPIGHNVCYSGWLAVTKEKFARQSSLVKYWAQLHKGVLIFSVDDTVGVL